MAFFDWNHDGKKDIWDTLYEYEMYRHMFPDNDNSNNDSFSGGIFDDDDNYSWRDYAEEGFDYGLDPEDFDTEEEYEEALDEAKSEWDEAFERAANIGLSPEDFDSLEEFKEKLDEVTEQLEVLSEMPVVIKVGVSPEDHEDIKPENYPNKRRYNAALAVAEDFFTFESFKEPAYFVNENADKVLAANYLSHTYGFLYAQAIKDNFVLPCSLPDEDEQREMDFYEILVKLAKYDIPLTFKVWNWCLEQFGPYVKYDEFSALQLSKDVFDRLYCFSDVDIFKDALVRYLNDNYDFCKTVMSLHNEYYYNLAELIAIAIKNGYYDTANILFRIELDKVSGHWKEINNLTEEIIKYCAYSDDVEPTEYFRDNMFSAIKAIPDGMVQDEIPDFEKTMAENISYIESHSEKYLYSRKNAWRTTAPDGKEYGLDPICYDSEQEYLDDLNEAKYGWRQWYHNAENEYGLDVNDYETLDEFQKAINAKRQEKYELERQAVIQKQREQQEEAAIDTTIYTYCGVLVPISTRPYSFRTDDDTIRIGDTVIVPIGPNNEKMEGTVVSIGQYARLGVPYPVEKTKKIIRKKVK